MSSTLNPTPPIPKELIIAAESGSLVVFIGAGISRMVGCPSWDGFASHVLNQLTPDVIDYHERSLINSIADPRKRLSIAKILQEEKRTSVDYEKIFHIDNPTSDIYEFINQFSCTFVTTNYDKLIQPDISNTKPEKDWRFYNKEDVLSNKLDEQGNVIHIHGCVDSPESMIITTKNYLIHYSKDEISIFLEYLFKNKTVLFLGYGLEETEILEYVLKGSNHTGLAEKRLFILQGFFNAELSLYEKLKKYYEQSFNAELIGFPKDYIDYEQQKEIIKRWSDELNFNSPTLVDELAAMEEELNG